MACNLGVVVHALFHDVVQVLHSLLPQAEEDVQEADSFMVADVVVAKSLVHNFLDNVAFGIDGGNVWRRRIGGCLPGGDG